jgi:hypothetical protein
VQTTARYAHLANDPLKRATEMVGGLFAEKRFAASIEVWMVIKFRGSRSLTHCLL